MKEKYARRDYLTIDRTHLANERTLLSYIRTSFAFFVLGAFLIKFLSSFVIIGIISIIFGFMVLIFGGIRFFDYKNKINKR